MTTHDIRISLLGGLAVVLPNGVTIQAGAFRTGKTADLLRILALNNGVPVLQSSLIGRLWPDVDGGRASASLRTAASQVRRSTGLGCVVRESGSLVLRRAWVDVEEFLAHVHGARTAQWAGDHDRALAHTRAGEALYTGDLHTHDDHSTWTRTHRLHLRRSRQRMLCDGAAAAIALMDFEEGRDLASIAVEIDPASEAAHRVLMHAYAELGEVASALRVFEAYRSMLADELGADPSPQTRALHLRLLRGG